MPKIEAPMYQLQQALQQITDAEIAINVASTNLRLAISELGQHTEDTSKSDNDNASGE